MNDSETYGLLIESLTHRQMYVEALNFLEEASDKNVHIPNRHIRLLRTRCEKLGTFIVIIYSNTINIIKILILYSYQY